MQERTTTKGEAPRGENLGFKKKSLEFSRSCSTDEVTLSAVMCALGAGSKWQKFAYWADMLNHFSCVSEKVLKSVSMSFSRSASAVNSTKRHFILTCTELTYVFRYLFRERKSEHSYLLFLPLVEEVLESPAEYIRWPSAGGITVRHGLKMCSVFLYRSGCLPTE